MFAFRRVALPALISFALVGCAVQPANQRGAKEVVGGLQPIDVTVGIKQSELYADFVPSVAGQAAINGCLAVPGIGLLLAAACGGIGGAADASINAERAKVADETIRPVKDLLVDIKFDELMNTALSNELRAIPGVRIDNFAATKNVSPKAYEEAYRASTAKGVMFITVDYHLSRDFRELSVTASSALYPRELSEPNGSTGDRRFATTESMLADSRAALRSKVSYQLRLPLPAKTTPEENVAAWRADGARAIRLGLQNATAELARLTAEDLQREPVSAKAPRGTIGERNGGQVVRYRDGSTAFQLSTENLLSAAPAAAATAPTAETASQ